MAVTIVVATWRPVLPVTVMLPGALMARPEMLRARLRPHMVRKSDFGARLLLWLVAHKSTLRRRRQGPVVDHALQVHSQFFHFGESLGSDVVASLAVDLLLHHPTELLHRFNKDVP